MLTACCREEPRADAAAVRRYLEALDASQPATGTSDFEALEAAFIHVAGPYSRRNGISYKAWRAVGVEDRVLDSPGISRQR